MSGDRLSGAALVDDERAQTVQDFAVGISIFLLVVGAVFLMFPSLFTPYEQAIADEGPDSQADRIGMLIADNVTGDTDGANELTEEEVEYWFDNGDLDGAVGVSSSTQVNVTMTTLGTSSDQPVALNSTVAGTDEASVGPEYRGRDASTAARIVRLGDCGVLDSPDDCETAYRLVVRVW